jgi:hypothetical protein
MAYRFKARSTTPGQYRLTDAAIANLITGDFPDAQNVLESDTTNGATGTYHEAEAVEVQAGVEFGPASIYTGTYSLVSPTTPTLTATISGTTATCVVAGDTGDTVTVYYWKDGDTAWTSGGAVTTSGTVTITGLTARTQYVFIAISTDGIYSFPCYPDIGTMQSATSTNITMTSYQNKVASTTSAVSITQEVDGTNTVEKIKGVGSGRMMMLEITIPTTAIAPIVGISTEYDPVEMEVVYDR